MSEATPIEQHDEFIRDGRLCRRALKLLVKLDEPDEFALPDGQPVLFAANHRSLLDIFVSAAVLSRHNLSCHLMVRADLFDKPLIGRWLHRIGCVPMSSAVKDEAIATAIERLTEGKLVAIMPEGRLVAPKDRVDGVGQPRPGLSHIASKAGVQVVPVAFHNTDSVWPRHRLYPWPQRRRPRVTLWVGPPMDLPHGPDQHQANADAVIGVLREMLTEFDTAAAAHQRSESPRR